MVVLASKAITTDIHVSKNLEMTLTHSDISNFDIYSINLIFNNSNLS